MNKYESIIIINPNIDEQGIKKITENQKQQEFYSL